jgi:type IV secretion system protein VirB1
MIEKEQLMMDIPVTIQHIEQCAPGAPANIVEAIIRTESGFNPLAMNVNRGAKLTRRPVSRKEAEAWARWLLSNGYNFDAGLMQINSNNWEKLGLTPENVFDNCENIRLGATLFMENYSRAATVFGAGRLALVAALSAYNSGDFQSGIHNGYASRVVKNIHTSQISQQKEIPPLVPSGKSKHSSENSKRERRTGTGPGEPDPSKAPTAIDGFAPVGLNPCDVAEGSRTMPAFLSNVGSRTSC